jgi:hypothetical protein
MENKNHEQQTGPTIRDLYPTLTEAELKEADENLERYLAFALRLYERIQADPEAYARFKALTASDANPTMSAERSSET